MSVPLLVFAGMLGGLPGGTGEDPVAYEDLFKWGEYDSLIRVLEPRRADGGGDSLLRALASRDDSLEEARSRMYLGVAYWAQGRPEAGVEAFKVATRLDASLRLDPLYSTPEMAARFEQLAVSAPARTGLLPPAPVPGGTDAPRASRPRAMRPVWTRMAAAAAAAGVAAVGGAVGTYYLIQSRKRPRETIIVINPE